MKSYKFSLLLIVLAINGAYSQLLWDADIEQKPYINKAPYEKVVQLPIKQVIHIKNSDTVAIQRYTANGKLEEHITFITGRRSHRYNYSYRNNIEVVTNFTYSNKRLFGGTIRYTNDGKIKEVYNYELTQKKDTVKINRQLGTYSYNEKGQLLKTTNYYDGNSVGENHYIYEDDLLVKAKINVHPLRKINTEYHVTYNSDKLPEEIGVYNISDKEVVQESYNKYTYENRRLVEENFKLKGKFEEIVADYKYTSGGDIKEVNIKSGNDSLQVVYEYGAGNQLMVKSTRATNFIYYKGVMLVPSGALMPYSGLQKYKYDDKGSLVEVISYIGESAINIERYIVDYFK